MYLLPFCNHPVSWIDLFIGSVQRECVHQTEKDVARWTLFHLPPMGWRDGHGLEKQFPFRPLMMIARGSGWWQFSSVMLSSARCGRPRVRHQRLCISRLFPGDHDGLLENVPSGALNDIIVRALSFSFVGKEVSVKDVPNVWRNVTIVYGQCLTNQPMRNSFRWCQSVLLNWGGKISTPLSLEDHLFIYHCWKKTYILTHICSG